MSSNNESGCVKTIGVLAGIATIIGVAIAILTWLMPFIPIGQSPLDSHQTNQQSNGQPSNNTVIPSFATNTFSPPPTDTPLPILIPTEPLLADTASGTILEFGQTWRQQGIEITLTDETLFVSNVEGAGVGFQTSFLNNKSFDVAVTLSMNNITAIDNFSRQLKVSHICYDGGCWISCEPSTYVLASGEEFDLCRQGMFFASVDISDLSITEIIITFSNASIGEARWRIPIYH